MGGSIKNNSRRTFTHTRHKTFPNVLALVFCVIGHVAAAQKRLGLLFSQGESKEKETDAEIPR